MFSKFIFFLFAAAIIQSKPTSYSQSEANSEDMTFESMTFDQGAINQTEKMEFTLDLPQEAEYMQEHLGNHYNLAQTRLLNQLTALHFDTLSHAESFPFYKQTILREIQKYIANLKASLMFTLVNEIGKTNVVQVLWTVQKAQLKNLILMEGVWHSMASADDGLGNLLKSYKQGKKYNTYAESVHLSTIVDEKSDLSFYSGLCIFGNKRIMNLRKRL